MIPGITDGYTGSAPDAGAFESGVTPWTAGANWKTWTAGNQAAAAAGGRRVRYAERNTDNHGIAHGGQYQQHVRQQPFLSPVRPVRRRRHNDPVGRTANLREHSSDQRRGSVTLNRVTSAWTNANVSYNQSVDTASAITGFYDPSNLDLYTDINITSWAQGWLSNPSTNYGLCLSGTENVVGLPSTSTVSTG